MFYLWPSAEANTLDGEGLLTNDNGIGQAECRDGVELNVYNSAGVYNDTYYFLCGTWSNQGDVLQDGVLAYPASLAETIAVGAVSNFDRRSDYAQWGPGLDLVAHSSGGTLSIVTTDLTGSAGYSDGDTTPGWWGDTSADWDYTNSFGGTSSATPWCSTSGPRRKPTRQTARVP